MRRKAVFFDRDNTLIVSDGYLGDPDKVRLVPGAADAVARVRRLGFATVIVSNQSGVARGMFDEAAVRAVNARLDQLLHIENPAAVIDHHEFCPYHPDAVVEKYRQDSELRKPRPGMIYRAREALALDLQGSWVIGDAPRDIDAGRAAGCRTILFQDPALSRSPAAELRGPVRADFTCTTLREAVDFIERNMTPTSTLPKPAAPAKSDLPERTEGGPARPLDPTPSPASSANTDQLLSQILAELKRRHELAHTEFSVWRLLAGMIQVIVAATLVIAYLNTANPTTMTSLLLLAIVLQGMVIAASLTARK